MNIPAKSPEGGFIPPEQSVNKAKENFPIQTKVGVSNKGYKPKTIKVPNISKEHGVDVVVRQKVPKPLNTTKSDFANEVSLIFKGFVSELVSYVTPTAKAQKLG